MDFVNTTLSTAGLPQKPVALTEWNIAATGARQMVSNTAGIFSVLVLGEAIKSKFGMTSQWDLANGWSNGDDHGMFNAGDEPDGVAKWNPRPSFFHHYFFYRTLGDRLVNSSVTSNPGIESYASTFSSGEVGLTLVNKTTTGYTIEVKFSNFRPGNRFYWYTLNGGTDHADFSRKVLVNGKGPAGAAGGPLDYKTLSAYSASAQNGIRVTIPPRSVVNLVVEKKP